MKRPSFLRAFLLLWILHGVFVEATKHNGVLKAVGNDLSGVNIECRSDSIVVNVKSASDFNGMIYPKGLSKNSTCLAEYHHAGDEITYRLPLRSCNTMSHDTSSEGLEYFNTIIIQPHNKLVTRLGRGFHVRCRYETKNRTANGKEVGSNSISGTPMVKSLPMPNCEMKIYVGRPQEHVYAERVRIGDFLTLMISIDDEKGLFGMKVTNCLVRDGLNYEEQPLINNDGCPIDPDNIMGPLEYSRNLTSAFVTYPAHKFPYTSSVYYECNVKICLRKDGGCDDVPPVCDETGHNIRRRRRKRQDEVDSRGNLNELRSENEDSRSRSVEVFSGLYVSEVDEDEDAPSSLLAPRAEDFCVSTRKFAIGIAIATFLLCLAVILLVACIVHRRRRRKGSSTTGSSIYSGPYSNHAYSRD